MPRSSRETARALLETDPARSALMARIRQKGTAPELAVRKIVSALGVRYTVENRDLPGSPDLANRARRWAIFVHGCFWHRHPGCRRASTPTRNARFWSEKFAANVRRDRRATRALRADGFRVIQVWECQTTNAERLARRVQVWLSRDAPTDAGRERR